jgi:uncharacterized protein (DUF849 family)
MSSNNRTEKTILTCAITGAVTDPDSTPYLPITPEQIAISALEAAEAGAAVVHVHVRDLVTKRTSHDLDLYTKTIELIRNGNKDLLINLTTGPGAQFSIGQKWLHLGEKDSSLYPAKIRTQHVLALKPDFCSIDFNTMNQHDHKIRVNHKFIIQEMIEQVQSAGVIPELELFDSGDLRLALEFKSQGLIDSRAIWQFAMGIKYGWDHTVTALDYARRQLPLDAVWSAFGISKEEMPMVAATWLHGGHVRVGLEDNIYLSKNVLAKSNAELVTKAVRIIENLGGTIATPADAREIFKIKK